MSTSLPAGHNFDRRSTQAKQGIVLVNAKLDNSEFDLREEFAAKQPDLVYYPSSAGGEERKAYNMEPALVVKLAASHGGGNRFDRSKRGIGTQESRVPIVTTLNYMRGRTADEVEEQLACIGLADNSERDSGGDGVNAISGGTITVTNTGPHSIRLGDLVMWKAPSRDELKSIKHVSGDIANDGRFNATAGQIGGRQRVPAVLVPYQPDRTDFLNRATFVAALNDIYKFEANVWKAPSAAPSKTGLDNYYRAAVYELVESLVEINLDMREPAAAEANRKDAGDAYRNKLLNELAKGPLVAGAGALAASVQRFMMASAMLRMRIENKVIGTARTGAKSGDDFDLQLHHYG